jgi:hypothetical protein
MTDSIHVKGEGGTIIKMDLPLPEAIEHRLSKGYLQRVNADGGPYTDTPTTRPPVNAPKAEWVGWSVAESDRRGAPITPDEADALTKQDLIERYGTEPVEQTDDDKPADAESSAEGEQPPSDTNPTE